MLKLGETWVSALHVTAIAPNGEDECRVSIVDRNSALFVAMPAKEVAAMVDETLFSYFCRMRA